MIESAQVPSSAATARPQAGRRWLGRADRRLLAALIAAILLITAIPYLTGYLLSPPERRFQGITFNVADNAQYFSWLRDHRSALLVPNRLTPEANEPALFNLLWLLIARAANLTGWGVPVLFQLLRLLTGAALLVTLYAACARFTRGPAERWAAYLTIALGAGMGWVWVVAKYALGLSDVPFPLDVYVFEPNTLMIIAAFPHFTIATTLILGIFLCLMSAWRRRSWALAAATAALSLLLTLQHAYDLLIIGLVPAGALALIALRDRRIPWFGGLTLALMGVVAAPPAAYFTWLTSQNPLWRQVLAQFDNAGVFTPNLPHLFILMGVPLFLAAALAAVELPALWRRATAARGGPLDRAAAALAGAGDEDLFLWSWLAVGFLLLYIPADFQIHMLNAWQVPVCLLAARLLLRQVAPWLAARRSALVRWLPALLVAIVLPTNLYLLTWRVLDLSRHAAPFYLSRDEEEGLSWLGEHATRDSVVLSGINLGQYAPVYSDGRSFLGHWAQTVDFYGKQAAVSRFFSGEAPDAERAALLERFQVSYVLYGPEERAMGAFDPAASPLLAPVFQRDELTIYRVR